MPLQIVPFTELHKSAVEAFNRRMAEGRAPTDFLLPTEPVSGAPANNSVIDWTPYVVVDEQEVRGGVLKMDSPGWLNGREMRAINFQSPLSEGIVNPKYSMVALQIVRFEQKQGDAVFMVGMGAEEKPLPRLLCAAGWSVQAVPLLFRVHRVGRFLQELRALHTVKLRSIAAGAARLSGAGLLGISILQRRQSECNGSVSRETSWGAWADEIWDIYRESCSFAVKRDRRTLASLYPTHDTKLQIFVIRSDRTPVGWAVCANTKFTNHHYFGDLQVGSILDCVAIPDAMVPTACLVDDELASAGADLVVLNHSHASWIRAFRVSGFLSGPSNYLLAMSKRLTETVRSVDREGQHVHITRGDGDGRIHLI
jgi:hypothetical protein